MCHACEVHLIIGNHYEAIPKMPVGEREKERERETEWWAAHCLLPGFNSIYIYTYIHIYTYIYIYTCIYIKAYGTEEHHPEWPPSMAISSDTVDWKNPETTCSRYWSSLPTFPINITEYRNVGTVHTPYMEHVWQVSLWTMGLLWEKPSSN